MTTAPKYTVYALLDRRDPRDPGVYRYVGRTRRPERRLASHFGDLSMHGAWLRSLRQSGGRPLMVCLETTDCVHESFRLERAWFLRLRAEGHPVRMESEWTIRQRERRAAEWRALRALPGTERFKRHIEGIAWVCLGGATESEVVRLHADLLPILMTARRGEALP